MKLERAERTRQMAQRQDREQQEEKTSSFVGTGDTDTSTK
jgi:hypothetical protein